ncbi:MAG: hypothetical protein WBP94_20075, partial [Rhodomicrobiaceae bacterium]
DVGGKRTAICVVNESGKIVWQGMVDTHPEMIAAALKRFQRQLVKVGLESGAGRARKQMASATRCKASEDIS